MPIASRRETVGVKVGDVLVGGGAPVVVQSMTNTETADVEATARQIVELADAGSELVRITVNTDQAALAVAEIVDRVRDAGYRRSHHRRFSLQRPQAADEIPAMRGALWTSTASTPATWARVNPRPALSPPSAKSPRTTTSPSASA